MENMAEDPVLKEHKLIAPGQPGAPSNMAGAIWKLAKEMFPDVRSKLSSVVLSLTSLHFVRTGRLPFTSEQRSHLPPSPLPVLPDLFSSTHSKRFIRPKSTLILLESRPILPLSRKETRGQETERME